MPQPEQPHRWAWAKLNAYGFVLAALAILAVRDLIRPANTDLARLAGEVPPGQHWWIIGFTVAGALLVIGFLRTDRVAESAGLVVLTWAIAGQMFASVTMIGWVEYTWVRLALLLIFGTCAWARISVLWSRDGLAVEIPARSTRRRR